MAALSAILTKGKRTPNECCVSSGINVSVDAMAVNAFTLDDVAKHSNVTSCWIVIADKVYDVTEFISEHPGGLDIILENAGTDATVPFQSKGHSDKAVALLEQYCIGQLVESEKRHKTAD